MTRTETLTLLKKHFHRWTYMVEHYGWKWTVYYHDSGEDMPADSSPECAAITTSDFKYLEAVIHVNLKRCEDMDEAQIEYICVHELVHLLVSPLCESSEDTPKEYTVTTIAGIMQGLRNA